jgi:non-ribosomal peptide synthetase component E (peptide arylation enzyme)
MKGSSMSATSDQLLRSAEYHQAGYWARDTFPEVMDRWADDDPRRPYLSDGSSTLTYGQFRDQAWDLAASLAGLSLGPGDRVAVQLPNWNEFFLVYAACARLGVIVIPVVPAEVLAHRWGRHPGGPGRGGREPVQRMPGRPRLRLQ